MCSEDRLNEVVRFAKVIHVLKLNPTFEEMKGDLKVPISREQLLGICKFMGYSWEEAVKDLNIWYGDIKLVD